MAKKKPMKEKADKRLRAKVTIGIKPDGSPRVKYAAAQSKKELEEKKAEIRQRHKEGLTDVDASVMFDAYAIEWYETYKRPHIAESSRIVYTSMLNKHILPALEDKRVKAIRAADLQRFLNEHSYMSERSVKYLHSILKRIFQRALLDGVITRDPAQGLTISYSDEEPRRELTEAEERAALSIAHSHPDGLLIALLYYTGMRRGEALGLQWGDIDFVTRKIHVQRDIDFNKNGAGELKTECAERTIPLFDELYSLLNPVRGIGSNYIITAPMTGSFMGSSTYRRLWGRLQAAMYALDNTIEHVETKTYLAKLARYNEGVKKAGKKYKGKKPEPEYGSILTPHYFRHNFASILYNAGVDVLTAQKYLGHKDIRTTLAIYSHLAAEMEDLSADKAQAAISEKVAKRLPEVTKAAGTKNTKSPNP